MSRSAAATSLLWLASKRQLSRKAASSASTAIGAAAGLGGASAGAAAGAGGASMRQQGVTFRLLSRNGTCWPLDAFSTSFTTARITKSMSSPGLPKCRSRLSVKTPLRPLPSLAVCPGAQAKATSVPAGASILARPRPSAREPPRTGSGLLRQASRTTRFRWHPTPSIFERTLETFSAL